MEDRSRRRAGHARVCMPWHGWLLGAVFLLYSIAAASDHVLSLALGAEFYRASGMSDAQVAWFSQVPAWAMLGWTAAVWGGLAGALALLMRSSFAAAGFALSLAGGLVYMLHALVLGGGRVMLGVLWVMPLVIAALTALLALYSRWLAQRGVLR